MAKGKKTGGRRAGSKNVLSTAAKEALALAFGQMGGVPALAKWAKANPTEFYKLWVRLLPVEVTGKDGDAIQHAHQFTITWGSETIPL